MTIGIAVLLHTGVVVVADGRVTNALNPAGERMSDDLDKIQLVGPTIAAVIGGAAMASQAAAQHVRLGGAHDANAVVNAATDGIRSGWQLLQATHPAEFESHGRLRAALVLGGIGRDGRPFAALIDQHQGRPLSVDGPRYGGWTYAIFSTDKMATNQIEQGLQDVANSHPLAGRRAAQAIAKTVGAGIRDVALRSITVGGRVRAKYITAAGVLDLAVS